MHTIILRSTDLCDKPVYRVFNFFSDDRAQGFHLTDDGIVPNSVLYMTHDEAYALIEWAREFNWLPFGDTRAVNEVEYYETMHYIGLD